MSGQLLTSARLRRKHLWVVFGCDFFRTIPWMHFSSDCVTRSCAQITAFKMKTFRLMDSMDLCGDLYGRDFGRLCIRRTNGHHYSTGSTQPCQQYLDVNISINMLFNPLFKEYCQESFIIHGPLSRARPRLKCLCALHILVLALAICFIKPFLELFVCVGILWYGSKYTLQFIYQFVSVIA